MPCKQHVCLPPNKDREITVEKWISPEEPLSQLCLWLALALFGNCCRDKRKKAREEAAAKEEESRQTLR